MSFNRPDLQTVLSRIQGDLKSRLPGSDPVLRHTLLGILAQVEAGGIHGLYGYLDWVRKQILPSTADADMLDRHGSIWGVPRKAATFAKGDVMLSGTDGSVVPQGALLQNKDGYQFSTLVEVTLAAGATVAVVALIAGAASNTSAGADINLVSPVAGVNSAATIAASGLSNGLDVESDALYRKRIIARIKEAPHGGAKFDYEQWALEVPGVTRAWVYPQELGIGTVTVRFVTDDAVNFIPDAAKVLEVQNYMDEKRPVTAAVTVVPPIDSPIDMTIQLTPNTSVVQDAVVAELRDLFKREAVPGGTILLSHIREAISLAAGESNHILTVPNADVAQTTGKIATLGVVTWV